MKGGKALAWGLAAVACAAIPAILLLNTGVGDYSQSWVANVVGPVAILTSVAVGLVVALRRPSNPIGWLLLANGLIFGWLGGFPGIYAGYALEHPGTLPGGRLAAVWDTAAWPLLFAGVVAIVFVFPDGRLLSRRWRPIAIGGAVAAVVTMAGGLLSGNALDPPFEDVAPLELLPDSITGAMQGLGLLGMFAALIAAAVAVVSRFRGSEGELRAQMKWVAYAAALIPVAILVGISDSGARAGDAALAHGRSMIAVPAADRDRGDALPALRDRPPDQPHAGLRRPHGRAGRGVRGGGASRRVALGGGSAAADCRGDARGRACLPPAAGARAGAGRSPVQPGALRGAAARGPLPRRAARGAGGAGGDRRAVLAAAASRSRACSSSSGSPATSAHADARGRSLPELPAEPGGRTPVRRGELQLGTVVHDPTLRESPGPARSSDPAGGPGDRDRAAAGRGPPSARRGRGVARADRHRGLRGAAPARARPPRRGAAAPGLDRARPAPRPARAGRRRRSEAQATLDSAVAGLADAIEELRELARGVRPAALDDGLAAALRELAAQGADQHRGARRPRSGSTTRSRPPPTSSPARP